jgi:hypothetical protein
MADETEEIENEETELDDETDTIDKATVQGWVREVIEDALSQLPGEGSVAPTKANTDNAPVTLREIERISRETVEAAMAPLRESLEKPKPKAKPKPKPEPEPKTEPVTKEIKTKLSSWLWGAE